MLPQSLASQPTPMFADPFSKGIFLKFYPIPPLVQMEDAFSSPISCYLEEEMTSISLQPLFRLLFVERNKTSFQSSILPPG